MTEYARLKHRNSVELRVHAENALFSDPITRVGGEKTTYQIPTYEALKGVLSSVYWKPTFVWYIDAVRVMNPIQTEVKGVRTIKYDGGNDLSYYTYLKNVDYQVLAHFEWNRHRQDLAQDRNENKHYEIAKKMIERGGRRDVFLGTRECQAYVEPCRFGAGACYYEAADGGDREIAYGWMYHGITYADEACQDEDKGRMTVNLWKPVMRNGLIVFPRPEDCPLHKPIREMQAKSFVLGVNCSSVNEIEVTR